MIRIRFILSLVLILGFKYFTYTQTPDYYFKHIGIEEGLSQSNVICIAQDSVGYMWFGTQEGLNRYDGYGFKTYKRKQGDTTSLSDNYINTIFKDSIGNLWVGTRSGGLNRYNYDTDNWDRIEFNSTTNNVLLITEDLDGTLWVGTDNSLHFLNKDNNDWKTITNSNSTNSILEINDTLLLIGTNSGLLTFNKNTNKLAIIPHTVSDSVTIEKQNIHAIIKGKDELFWIGTKNGLYSYNHLIGEVDHIEKMKLYEKDIRCLFYEKRKSELWMGTYGDGLNIFNTKTDEINKIESKSNEPGGLSNNFIFSVFKSKSGLMWIGTQREINLFDIERKQFQLVQSGTETNSLNNNFIWSFYEDDQGILWIGTDRGLNKYDPSINKWEYYSSENSNLKDNTIRVICKKNNSSNLWLGTKNGLYKFDYYSGNIKRVDLYHNNKKIENTFIKALHEDKSNQLWIGTDEGGIIIYNYLMDTISYCQLNENSNCIGNNRILRFFEDTNGELWVGTFGNGLNKYDKESEKFINYKYLINKDSTLNTINSCLSFYQIDSNTFWVGTIGDGLLKFNKTKKCFVENYTIKEGLPNNTVYGILADSSDCLWLSTNAGLCKFDTKKITFWNFDVNDGLQSNEFNAGAYYKNKEGKMFFGGVNGFNVFYPDSIKKYQSKPPVIITSISVNLNGEPQNILHNPDFVENGNIDLNFSDNSFYIEYVTIHYPTPKKIIYKYSLIENGEEDTIWQYPSYKNRSAPFYGVTPGDYKFIVKSTNCDGVWEGTDQVTKIEIKVKKPFYYEWWFYIGITVIVFAIVLWLFKYLEGKIKNATEKFEIEHKEKLDAEKQLLETTKKEEQLELLDKLIGWFSHETKTPLEVAYTGLTTNKKLLDKFKNHPLIVDKSREFYRIQRVNENSDIILDNIKLTNRIIADLRLISLKQLSSDLEKIELKEFLLNIFEKLKYQRGKVTITMNLTGDVEETISTYPIALEQIFSNLIVNSIKHGFKERSYGEIEIKLKRKENKIEIEYTDNGVGIEKGVQHKIFKEFYSSIKGGGGTGLGLAITKAIIERDFDGNIRLKESKPNLHTTFEFSIKRFDHE